MIELTSADWVSILPALCLIGAGLLAVCVDLVLDGAAALVARVAVSSLGTAVAGFLLWNHLFEGRPAVTGFSGGIVLDALTAYVSLGIVLATLLLVGLSAVDTARRHVAFGEYYALVLGAAGAMLLLVASNDFVLMFLNLETVSLALYVLCGITRRNPRSNEAAMKYLVTGGFATGFLLFGMALLYGATGSFRIDGIGAALASGVTSPLVPVGVVLILVGLAFKLGAVPFHMWVPDVYEGAPTSTTAYMAVAVKAAAIGTLARILLGAFLDHPELWATALWWMAVATVVVGNLLAAQQRSVKRMLAYSGVSHTGYALIALAAMAGTDGTVDAEGASAAVFYAFVYTFMTFGAFAFLVYMGHEVKGPSRVEWQDAETLDDVAGLSERRPWAAAVMALFLVSLGGLPPTAGFVGKFQVFRFAVEQGHYALAIIGVLASLVSLWYYLRVVVAMYMREPVSDDEKPSWVVGAVVAAAAAATVLLGLQPGLWLLLAETVGS